MHMQDLFADPSRWPRRPYCTDDLETGLRIRSLAQAITKPYIQANPPHLRCWLLFDVDRPGGAIAWEDANLPPPAWAAANPLNAHAHLAWGLTAPVLLGDASMYARSGPIRYLEAVERAMLNLLEADPGFAGLITKNPAHPHWSILRGPQLTYTLDELARWIPYEELYRHTPKTSEKIRYGVGRNIFVFDHTRQWAYPEIRNYWGGGLQAWNAWFAAVYDRALTYNGDLQVPMHPKEVWHIAKSVAKWVWRHFTPQSFREFVARTHGSEAQRSRRLGKQKKETQTLEQWLANGSEISN